MLKLKTYNLHFTSPLHISNIRADYSNSLRTLHSDAMYAAIMQTWALLGKVEWIDEFIKTDAFSISSLFPFCPKSNEDNIYFFPKPYSIPKSELKNPSDAKKLKKVNWVDKLQFDKLLNGNGTNEISDAKGIYLSSQLPNKHKDFIDSSVTPRILRPRDEQEDTVIFYIEKIYFKYNSGLYFCFDSQESNIWTSRLETALNYLQYSGLGTDRNVGNGQFTWSVDEIQLNTVENSNYSLNLSLYCPEDAKKLSDQLDENARYDLIKRGGWISEPYNSYRKKSIYMFKEGAVLQIKSNGISTLGKTNNLAPNNNLLPENQPIQHPIWRVGKSIFIPYHIAT